MKIKRAKNNQKGITLVELLIYMGLLSILLVTITDMFVAILDVKVESEALSSVEQDSQYIITRLNYDINRANNILSPANPGDTSNTLALEIDGITYTYQLNNGNLEITAGGISDVLNTNTTNITGLNFRKIGPPNGNATVQISLNIESLAQTHAGTESKNFVYTVGTR